MTILGVRLYFTTCLCWYEMKSSVSFGRVINTEDQVIPGYDCSVHDNLLLDTGSEFHEGADTVRKRFCHIRWTGGKNPFSLNKVQIVPLNLGNTLIRRNTSQNALITSRGNQGQNSISDCTAVFLETEMVVQYTIITSENRRKDGWKEGKEQRAQEMLEK